MCDPCPQSEASVGNESPPHNHSEDQRIIYIGSRCLEIEAWAFTGQNMLVLLPLEKPLICAPKGGERRPWALLLRGDE